MLAYVLRRLAWAIPTLMGVVVTVYFLSTLLPIQASAGDTSSGPETLKLPRFFNRAPDDVYGRVRRAVEKLSSGSESAGDDLAHLGSAGWPALMQLWPELDGPTRERAAHAAMTGMSLRQHDAQSTQASAESHSDAAQLALLWSDRSLDFSAVSRSRALQRLLDYPSAEREADYASLGTYGLEPVFEQLQQSDRRDAWMALTRVASAITGIQDTIHDTDDDSRTSACLVRWRRWWLLHESQYTKRSSLLRPFAPFTETGFGMRLGAIYLTVVTARATGELAAFARLADSFAATLSLLLPALAISYLLASAYAALSHARLTRRGTALLGTGLSLLLVLPAFVLARGLHTWLPGAAGAYVGPLFVMVAACMPGMARQSHAALSDAMRSDSLRTARAKGASEPRVLFIHALRTIVGPTLVWTAAQVPALLGLSLLVENLWDVRGLGWHTLRAVQQRNESALMANTLLLGIVAVASTVLSDVLNALLDPRARKSTPERVVP